MLRRLLHPDAPPGAILEEAPAGSAEALREDLNRAAQADANSFPRPEGGYIYVIYVFPDANHVVVRVSGMREEKIYQAKYAIGDGGAVTFADVKPVIERTTIEPVAETEKPIRGRAISISEALIESEVLETGGVEKIRGRVILEDIGASGDIFSAKGWLPFGVAGRQSKGSGRVYDRSFFESLMPNMALGPIGMLDGRRVYFGPPGAMYASHNAITMGVENPLTSIVGMVKGVEEREGVYGAIFETLPTHAGKDMAVLLNCTDVIGHGSVRALPIDDSTDTYRGSDGLVHARRGRMHGIDFTDMPGTPFNALDPRVTLEEELLMKPDELAKLKETDPAKYSVYMATFEAEKLRTTTPAPSPTVVPPNPAPAGPSEREKQLELQNATLMRSVGRTEIVGMIGGAVDTKAQEQKIKLPDEARTDVVDRATGNIDRLLAELERKKVAPGTPEYRNAAEPLVAAMVESEVVRMKKFLGALKVGGLEEQARTPITGQPGDRDFPQISRLTPEGRMHGGFLEEAYGRYSDEGAQQLTRCELIMARALNKPVRRADGSSIFDEFQPGLNAFLEQQRRYYVGIHSLSDLFRPSGALAQQMEGMKKAYLEADEMTFSKVFGSNTLVNDVLEGVLKMLYPQLQSMQLMTQHTDLTSETFEVWTENFRRASMHAFGYVDKSALTTLSSGTSGGIDFTDDLELTTSPGRRIYGLVTEAISSAAFTVTVTCKNTNGQTTTATRTFPLGTAANTILEFRPTIVGDKYVDVSAVVAVGAGGAGTGEVGIFAPAALGYTENAKPPLSIIELSKTTATCEWMELAGAMSQRTLWNFLQSVQDGPGRGYNGMSQLVTLLVQEVMKEVEMKAFYTMISQATGANQTLDLTQLPAGLTQLEHNQTFIKKYNSTVDEIEIWSEGLAPEWCVAHTSDRTLIEEWTRGAAVPYPVDQRDAFYNARAWARFGGLELRFSQHTYPRRLLFGRRAVVEHGTYVPLQLLGPVWNPNDGNQWVDRLTCAKTHVSRPNGLGTLQITAT